MAAGSTPDIPEEDHDCLVDYGYAYLRVKDGGTAIQQCQERLKRFLETVKKRADFVRARAQAAKYDRLPAELTLEDVSRLVNPARS
jgi:hypothetical protein